MDKIVITGGRKLQGEVRVSGAKNAALPILVSSLLVDGWNTFRNIPDLRNQALGNIAYSGRIGILPEISLITLKRGSTSVGP